MKKRIIVSIFLMLLLALPFSVSAAETGSLTLHRITKPAVVYHVADESGNPTQDFGNILSENLSEKDLSPKTAKQLQSYTKEQNLSGLIGEPDASNQIAFSSLEKGYYLVCSTQKPGEFASFLIKIPMEIGNNTVYDIEATPKSETPEDDPTPDPDIPPTPIDPQPNIPQTGFIEWPKYLLLILGGGAILFGFIEILRGRRKTHE